MQENRTFDNFFWTYPGQIGYKANLCMPYYSQLVSGCLKPVKATSYVMQDIPHNSVATLTALDNGKMDGFLKAARLGNPSYPFNMLQARAVMSYYGNSTLPYYWAYAKHYVLADQYFSSAKSQSQPNHWYMIAGKAPPISLTKSAEQERAACYNPTTQKFTMSTCTYINQAKQISTMADMLTSNGISWKYYDTPMPQGLTLQQAIKGGPGIVSAFNLWSPLLAKSSTYTSYANSMVARQQLFSDLKGGTLPQVSWVVPSQPISDHPRANVLYGMWWITDIVDSVMASRYWDNSLIVVVWDDYGGFFDTVRPPPVDGAGLSFRVPALIISPYAKTGYLDHTSYDFESTLKFIEWDFGLPALSYRDAIANNLLNALNFGQWPQDPFVIPLSSAKLKIINPYIALGSNTATHAAQPVLQFIDNDPD